MVAYELIWAYAMVENRPVPADAVPLDAFPLESYDQLVLLPLGTLSTLPRVPVATAIGWNPALLQKLALEREHLVVIFEEGDGETESRTVVYFGHAQFFSFSTMIAAVGFLLEFWHTEPLYHQCDGDDFGTRWLRDHLILEYEGGFDHWNGIERGWNWLGNL
ncbi:hypothetical protein C8R41DRAFT_920978 [Lentinula lateritia]|uniref:Uncharacterized protein n=1 Tax=Lentinula lateritia TaxID=40482 RepID=A0ABQ8VCH6_9AGAR|nr:hypothetical protein C8R41DRAFT_920978 [Lentinula lateritia]